MGWKPFQRRPRVRQRRNPLLFEELEPRLLFSADIEAVLPTLLTHDDYARSVVAEDLRRLDTQTLAPSTSDQQRSSDTRREVVFVDSAVPDLARTLAALEDSARERNLSIVVLDAQRDGVEQISAELARHAQLDAVHVISHGSDGVLQLGNGQLDLQRVLRDAAQLSAWQAALTDDADLLLYGCDLAASNDGAVLLETLSRLVNVDVAASDDVTGSVALGGDWDLEYVAGDIETDLALGAEFRDTWRNTLLAPVLDLDADNSSLQAGADYSASFTSSGPPVLVAGADATLTDPESDNVTSLVITITNPLNGGDELLSADVSGTSISADLVGAVLTLSGSDSAANYQQVLRTVVYENTASTPDETTRVITLVADDGAASNSATAFVAINPDTHNALWLATDGDVSSPGADGLTSWQRDEVISFGGPTLAFGSATDGEFAANFDASAWFTATAEVHALHFVGSDLSVGSGGAQVQLNVGDLLFSTKYLTVQAAFSDTGADKAIQDRDLLLFRPDTPGDYSSGTISVLLDDPLGGKIFGATLIETDTVVGGTMLAAGTFLLGSDVGIAADIRHYTATGVGEASTSGAVSTLIDGSDVGIGAEIFALELIEAPTDVGGVTLQTGTILVSIKSDDNSIGSNGLPTLLTDTFALNVTSTGVNTSAATATLFLDGSDVNLNTASEAPTALALIPDLAPILDLDLDDSGAFAGENLSTNFTPSAGPVAIADADARLIDVNGFDLTSLVITITNPLDGADELLAADVSGTGIMASYSAGVLTLSGPDTAANYQQVLRTVTYDNTAATPDNTARTITFAASNVIGTDTATAFVAINADVASGFWTSTDSDIGAPGADGLPSGWTQAEIIKFGGASLQFGSDTDGDFSSVFNFDDYTLDSSDPSALHFVSRDITVGTSGRTVDLRQGDVLVSFNQTETILAAFSASGINQAFSENDLLLFRPDVAGDYSTGTFSVLLEDPSGAASRLHGLSLVETDTQVGDAMLTAGTFIITTDGLPDENILLFAPTSVGAGTTSGTLSVLLDTADLNLEAGTLVRGVELVEEATTVGGVTLQAGTLLATLRFADTSVGNNNLSVTANDMIALHITTTGAGTTSGTASLFLDGSDVNLDGAENPYAVSLLPSLAPVLDLDPDDSSGTSPYDINVNFTAGGGAVAIADVDAALVDLDSSTLDSLVVTIQNPLDGANELLAANTGGTSISAMFSNGVLTLSGTDTVANYQTVLRTVTYNNTTGSPDAATRQITFVASNDRSNPIANARVSVNGENSFRENVNGYNGTQDTELREVAPDNATPQGSNPSINLDLDVSSGDDAHALIRFDNIFGGGAIPLGSTIHSASLTINVTGVASAGDNITLHRMLIDWDQGTATWNSLTNGVQADNADAVSFADSRLENPDQTGSQTFFELADALQAWSDGASNYGWYIATSSTNGFDFTSSEGAEALRPRLTVDYSVQPVASNLNAAETYTEGAPLDLIDIVVSDADSTHVTATLTLSDSAAGALNTATSGSVTSTFSNGVWSASGAIADVNTLLAGLTFTPATDYATSFSIATNVDDGVTANVSGVKNFTATQVNDEPELLTGSVSNLVVAEDSGFTSLGLGALTYGPGGGADEAGQTLTYTIIALPDAGLGEVYLADETTKVTLSSYSLADLQGMKFKAADAANGGPETFSFAVSDDGGTANGGDDTLAQSLTISVTAQDDGAPVAVDDSGASFTTAEATMFTTGSVLGNDTLLDHAAITAFDSTSTAGGTVTNNGDGTFDYTPPDNDFNGTDTFTYTLTDDDGQMDTATVTITVDPADDGAPVAVDDTGASFTTTEATMFTTDSVLTNDTLLDHAAITAFDSTSTAGGTVTSNGDGTFDYTPPDNDFNGTDTFTYTLTDDDGQMDTATVTITVDPADDGAPIAVDDSGASFTTTEATMFTTGSVLGNDTLLDHAAITAVDGTSTAGGTVTSNGDGTFDYTPPDNDFNGTDTFTYTLTDDDGQMDTATVTITVDPADDGAPIAVDDTGASFTTTEATMFTTGSVLGNDTLLDHAAITAFDGTSTAGGTVTSNGDGTFDYTPPDNDFNGTDTFTYTLTDDDGQMDTATVTITVDPADDGAPIAVDDTGTSFTTTEATMFTTGSVLGNDTLLDHAAITAFDATSTAGGTVTSNGDGTFDYTPPDNDFNGTDTFTYTLTDDDGQMDTATVTITVDPADDGAPIAVDDSGASFTTTEATMFTTGSVLGNDTLLDHAAITAFDGTSTAGGTVTSNGDGTFDYTPPDNDFNGTDTFTYTLTDDDGQMDTATVTITVDPADDGAPIAVDDSGASFTTTEATMFTTGSVLGNDTLLDHAAITAFDATSTAGGTVISNGDGTFDYTPPDNDFNGTDTFTYTLTDDDGQMDTATVTITVDPADDGAPVAVDDTGASFTTTEATMFTTGSVLGNDTLLDHAAITAFDSTSTAGGTVTSNGDGTFDYTPPDNDFNGTDTFTYTLTDDDGQMDTATVTITVDPADDGAPVAVGDTGASFTTTEATMFTTGSVLGNDTLLDHAAITAFDSTSTAGGTVTSNGDGTFDYTPPDNDFNGTDTFTYTLTDDDGQMDTATVTITVDPADDGAPIAVDDSGASFTTTEATMFTTGSVLGNDTLLDHAAITAFDGTSTAGGTVTSNGDGTFDYTPPDNDFNGTDTFTYTLTDDDGQMDTATVTITVDPADDGAPIAVDDSGASFTTTEATMFTTGSVLGNDTLLDHAAITAFDATSTAGGTVISNGDGTFDYTPPDNDFNGTDTFTYTLTDDDGQMDTATVTITVDPADDGAPIAVDDSGASFTTTEATMFTTGSVLGNDTLLDHAAITAFDSTSTAGGTVTSNGDGTFDYTPPDNDFNGTDTFTYTLTDDDGQMDTATVTITVDPADDGAPVAVDDTGASFTTTEATMFTTGSVLGNDTLLDHAAITAFDSTSTAGGTVTSNGDGTFDYTPPDNDFNGTDTFTYTLTDDDGQMDTATVTITVDPADDGAPIAVDDSGASFTTTEATMFTTGSVLGNDTLLDHAAITAFDGTSTAGGTVTSNGDGTFDYTPPDNDFNGTDTFTYTLTDDDGQMDTATVTITVDPADDGAPIAVDDSGASFTTTEATMFTTGSVLGNDTLLDHAAITAFDATSTAGGTVTSNGDGTFDYTPPDNDFNGTDTFTYTLTDDDGQMDTATVTITVDPADDGAPIAVDDSGASFTTTEATMFTTGSVLGNDTLLDHAAITAFDSTSTAGGTVTSNGDGTFDYTPPDNDFNGTDTFTYTLTDDDGQMDTATVTITVDPADDGAPIAVDDSGASFTTTEATMFTTGSVLGNDTLLDHAAITAFDSTSTAGGTVTSNGDGTFDYTPPDNDFNGTDTFTYTLTDDDGQMDTATVTITVDPADDGAPVAVDDTGASFTTTEATMFTTGSVLGNDTLLDHAAITAFDATSTAGGTVTSNGDGTFDYTPPDNDFNGTDTFTYTLTDDDGQMDTATVTITVDPADDGAPVAVDDTGASFTTTEATMFTTGSVLGNDTLLDHAAITAFDSTSTAGGTVTSNGDGTFDYTPPDNDFNGTDTFTYTLTDDDGQMDTATVTITVDPADDGAPVAVDDTGASFTTTEATMFTTGSVLGNDTLLDHAAITAFDSTSTAGGTVTSNGDGTFDYTPPDNDFNGTDTFTYTLTDDDGQMDTATVTITVDPADDGAPIAVDDSGASFTTTEATMFTTGSVLGNDTLLDHAAITAFDGTSTAGGTVTSNGDGTFDYTPPDNDFNGTDTFTYTLTDDDGQMDTATVTITVDPADDGAPIAVDDSGASFTTTEATMFTTGSVLGNDTLLDHAAITAFDATSTAGGTVISNGDGTFDYTPPDNDFNGTDTFTYTLTDDDGQMDTATVTITVDPADDGAPIAVDDSGASFTTTEATMFTTGSVLGNDTLLDHAAITAFDSTSTAGGTVTSNGDGTFDYTPPDNDFNGTDTFTYTLTDDDGQMDTATVTITVDSADDGAPVAVDDTGASFTTTEATMFTTGSVLGNDTLLDHAAITAFDSTSTAGGTVTSNGDGTFDYTPPDNDFNGTDTFTYTLTDDDGQMDTATVTITVDPADDGAPIAVDDSGASFTTTEATMFTTGSVLGNDTLLDHAAITAFDGTSTAGGTVTSNGDGTFDYTPPDNDFNGTDTFTYTLTDDDGQMDTATVTITVDPADDGAPIAVDDSGASFTTTEATMFTTGSVLGNDTLLDHAAITAFDATSTAGGTVISNGDGTFDYTPPDNDFNGTDTFTYTLTDDDGQMDTATVTITVDPADDGAPIAVDDSGASFTTTEATMFTTGSVLGNDTLLDHAAITAFDSTSTAGGTVTSNGDGTFDYTPPDNDFNGTDTFTYTLTDDDGQMDTATVTITVDPADDGAPVAVGDTGASFTTTEATMFTTGSVLGNDTLLDHAAITAFDSTSTAGGTVTSNGDGTFDYTPPDNDFNGTDTFTYTLTDDDGQMDTATVTITVDPADDGAPIAVDDSGASFTTTEATMFTTGSVLGNDTLLDHAAITAFDGTSTAGGTVTSNGDGTFDYTPPDNDFNGTDTFTYTLTDDDGQMDTATVTITVDPADDGAPIAVDDSGASFTTTEATMFTTGSVLGNDTLLDHAAITAFDSTSTAGGTVTSNGDGTFDYTPPDNDFNGTDTFTYTLTDDDGQMDTATVTITVDPADDGAPIAVDDSGASFTTTEATMFTTGSVLGNDTLLDHAAITAVDGTSTAGGTVTSNGDGTFDYTPPDNDFNGTDTFTYTLTDDDGQMDTATVTITVDPADDGAPIAVDDTGASFTTTEATMFTTGSVLGNDTLLDHAAITAFDGTSTAGGTVTSNGDGTFDYTPPDNDFNGTDTFTYTLTDDDGQMDTATVTITVDPADDGAPIAVDDTGTSFTTTEATMFTTGSVLGNDTLLDHAAITAFDATSTAGGTVTSNGDGTFDYTPPDNDFNGTDTFTYTLTDDDGQMDTATVTITVDPADDGAPIAVDDSGASFTTTEATMFTTGSVLGNDTLLDHAAITAFDATSTAGGTVTSNGDGTFDYTPPDNDFNGTDTFTYTLTDDDGQMDTATVTITVDPADDGAPVAVDDTGASFTTTEATMFTTGSVLGNDTLLDHAAITAFDATSTAGGTVTSNGDGTFDYTPPDNDFNGTDTFTYTLTDDDGQMDTATVTITVDPADDGAPVAVDDTGASFTTTEATMFTTGSVLGNDTLLDHAAITAFDATSTAGGTVTSNGDGTFDYTPPDNDFNGTDTFTYTLTDDDGQMDTATVTITVDPADDGAPVAVDDTGASFTTTEATMFTTGSVLGNDTLLDHAAITAFDSTSTAGGTVTSNGDGTFDYTPPDNDFNGTDTFTYTLTDDDGQMDTATVTITVDPADDGAPVAVDDTGASFTTTEATMFTTGSVLGNDTLLDHAAITAFDSTSTAGGTVTSNGDGTFDYTPPDNDFNGTDTFTYTLTDDDGQMDTATVTITVDPADDGAPIAVDDSGASFTTTEATMFTTGSVLGNDTLLDHAAITAFDGTSTAGGTVTSNGDGTFDYTPPDNDFNGTDTFTYTLTDDDGQMDTATVTITVDPADDGAPIAVDDSGASFTTTEATMFTTGSVLGNDTLLDHAAITAFDATSTAGGTVISNGDGTFDYTPPDNDFNGTDTFTYTLTDDDGQMDTATVTITVDPADDGAPIAVDDSGASFTTTEATMFTTGSVLGNDTLLDHAAITAFDSTSTAGGTVTSNGDGTFDYTPPDNDFNGTDTFTYTLTDDDGQMDTATVTITVDSADDGAPVAVDDTGASFTTTEATTFTTGSVLSNDTLLDHAAITAFDATSTAGGTVTSNGDGTFDYTPPDNDFNGTDTFTYTLTDDDGQMDTATVTITVDPADDGAPVAVDDTGASFTTTEATMFTTGSVLGNDTLLDHAAITAFDATSTAGGTVTSNGDGTFDYTPPDNDFNGTDTFTYTLTDDDGQMDTATVTITVDPADDGAPIAVDDTGASFTTTEATMFTTGSVLGNDTLLDHAAITAFDATSTAGGTVTSNGDGTFDYTPPDNDFNGTDTFTYTLTDDDGQMDTATVTITVDPADDGAPIAVDDSGASFTTTEATMFTTGSVLSNDTLLDHAAITAFDSTSTAGGTVTSNGDGTFDYTPPDNDFNGTDTFTYTLTDDDGQMDTATVTITVDPADDGAPIAVDDSGASFTTTEATMFTTGSVLGNDTLLDHAAITAFDGTSTAGGTVTSNGDGTFDYTPPDNDFNGTDTFTYTLTDDDGQMDTATVTITVDPADDGAPIAVDDTGTSFTTTEATMFTTGSVLGNDTLLDHAAITAFDATSTAGGTVTSNGDGTFDYTPPDNDFNGTDTFTYTLTDDDGQMDTATVTITVDPADDGAPIAVDDSGASFTTTEATMFTTGSVLGNDTLLDHAAITAFDSTSTAGGTVTSNSDGTFDYTPPDNDFNGTDSFTYTLTDDDGQMDTATVTITVDPADDGAPIAVDDSGASFTTTEATMFTTGSVLGNDTLLDHAAITAFDSTSTAGGTVTSNGDGTFHYTPPDTDFNGTDTFTYTLTDDDGQMDTATVTITVDPADDGAPIAVDDTGASFTTTEATMFTTGNVLGNDTLLDHAAITAFDATSTAGGTVTSNGDGTFDYTPPDNDFNGTDTFTYTLTDDDGQMDTATVTITVDPADDGAPIAVDDTGASFTTTEATPFTTGSVLGNDTLLDHAAITAFDATSTAGGTITTNGDGTFNYTPPDNDFNGTDTFTYTLTDDDGRIDTATVTITVDAANDGAPIAVDDIGASFTTTEATPFTTGSVLSNDTLLDHAAITAFDTATTAGGSITSNDNGTFNYTPPDADFHGADTFTYTVTDDDGQTATATVNLQILSQDDGVPIAADDAGEGFAGAENTPFTTANVLRNDSLPDSAQLTAFDAITVAGGSVAYNNDGTFTYTPPDADFNGADSFTYTLSDDTGDRAVGNVTLQIANENDAPVVTFAARAPSVELTVQENQVNIAAITAIDADNDALSYTLAGQDAAHFAIDTANGTLTFAVQPNFEQPTDSDGDNIHELTVVVTDPSGASTSQQLRIEVLDLNEAPVVLDQAFTLGPANRATADSIGVVAGIISGADPDSGDQLKFAIVGGAGADNFSIDADTGELSAVGDGFAAGQGVRTLTLQIQVTDSQGLSATATVDVTSSPSATTASNSQVTTTDPDPDPEPEPAAPVPAEPVQEVSTPPAAVSAASTANAQERVAVPPAVDIAQPVVVVADQFAAAAQADVQTQALSDIDLRPANSAGATNNQGFVIDLSSVFSGLGSLELDNSAGLSPAGQLALEDLQRALEQASDEAEAATNVMSTAVAVVSTSLSAGAAAWVLRAGALATSLMSVLPMWNQLDPLPILNNRDSDHSAEDGAPDDDLQLPLRGNEVFDSLFDTRTDG